jgi:hypothetical protein
VRIFYTLEIWQSSFDAPTRVVANVGHRGLQEHSPLTPQVVTERVN